MLGRKLSFFAIAATLIFTFASAHGDSTPSAPPSNILSAPSTDPNDYVEVIPVTDLPAVTSNPEQSATADDGGAIQIKDEKIFFFKVQTLENFGDKFTKIKQYLVDKSIAALHKMMSLIADVPSEISKTLDNLNISLSPKQNIWSHADVLGLSVGFTWATAPAYIGACAVNPCPKNTTDPESGLHSRRDGWLIGLQTNPLNWKPWSKWVLFNVHPQVQMDFWQFFNSRQEAEHISHWYKPWKNFPYTAEKALDTSRMKVGDVAHIQYQVGAQLGAQGAWQMAEVFTASLGLGYLLNGQFDFFIMKAENNTFHVRMILQRQHGVFGQRNFGVNDNFTPFGWHPLNNALVNVTNLDQIIYGYRFMGDLNAYMGDYTLDLSKPEVAAIYDKMIKEIVLFDKNEHNDRLMTELLDPTKKADEVGAALKFDLSPLDKLYFEDMNLKDGKRVDRNFSGADFAVDHPNVQHRNGIGGIIRDTSTLLRRDNKLTQEVMQPDGNDAPDFYSFPTWSASDDFRAMFSIIAHNSTRTSNIISKLVPDPDEAGKLMPAFDSIGFYFDYTNKRYSEKVHDTIFNHYDKILPSPVIQQYSTFLADNKFSKIDSGIIPNVKGHIPNVRLSARYFIGPDGFAAAQKQFEGLTLQERVDKMRGVLLKHLDRVPITDDESNFWHQFSHCGKAPYSGDDKVKHICKDVEDIATHLAIALDDDKDASGNPVYDGWKRQKAIEQLSTNSLFLEVGPGFLMSAIPDEDIDSSAFFQMKYYLPNARQPLIFEQLGPDGKPVKFPHREFYETILDIQNMMSNMTPDMRLPSEVDDDLTHRKTRDDMSNGKIN